MNKKIIISIVVATLGGFFWYFFFAPGDMRDFLAAYHAYDTVSVAEENAAHIPGNGGNVSRQKLNEILSRVLTENLPSKERQKL